MASSILLELHIKSHRLAHPFEHIAHGGLVLAAFMVAKTIAGILLITVVHISFLVLLAIFVSTTAASVFAERKFLKKEIKVLRRKL